MTGFLSGDAWTRGVRCANRIGWLRDQGRSQAQSGGTLPIDTNDVKPDILSETIGWAAPTNRNSIRVIFHKSLQTSDSELSRPLTLTGAVDLVNMATTQ